MPRVQSPTSKSESDQRSEVSTPDIQARAADFGTLGFELTVTDLRKSYLSPTGEKIEVLRGASFSASSGEAVAIMGASGAGKSTLLHLLGGLDAADHGTIVAGGFSIARAGRAALARFRNERVGFVFQFHHLLPDFTAAENVSLPLRITRIGRREAMRRAFQLLEDVGLDKRTANSVVGHLSGGEQQRVAVCRALITLPTLVLADEPTGNLDTTTGEAIARSIVSYAQKHHALVLIATHNHALAEMCDRSLVLRDGRISQPWICG